MADGASVSMWCTRDRRSQGQILDFTSRQRANSFPHLLRYHQVKVHHRRAYFTRQNRPLAIATPPICHLARTAPDLAPAIPSLAIYSLDFFADLLPAHSPSVPEAIMPASSPPIRPHHSDGAIHDGHLALVLIWRLV